VKTVSDPDEITNTEWLGPLYLDASALVKLYFTEQGSDALDAMIQGRNDLIISDLAITEIVSALSRRRREGILPPSACGRLHRKILADVDAGFYQKIDLTSATHREAERLLLAVDDIGLRAADALHLACATLADAASIVTYDRRLSAAAIRVGLHSLPMLSA
jgi:uncharacterized protein